MPLNSSGFILSLVHITKLNEHFTSDRFGPASFVEVPNGARSSSVSRIARISSALSLSLSCEVQRKSAVKQSAKTSSRELTGAWRLLNIYQRLCFPHFHLCSVVCTFYVWPSHPSQQARLVLYLSLSLSLSSAHLSNLSWNTPGKLPLIGCHLGLLAPSVDIQLPELFPGFHITCRISIEFNLPSLDSQDAFFLFRE